MNLATRLSRLIRLVPPLRSHACPSANCAMIHRCLHYSRKGSPRLPPWGAHAVSACRMILRVSIPRQSPGALDYEPLKAAVVASHAMRDRLMHRKFTVSEQPVSTAFPRNTQRSCHVSSPRFGSVSLPTQASDLAARDLARSGGILLEMSNCYCHPGRAGGNSYYIRTLEVTRDTPPELLPSMAVDLLRGNRLELPWLGGKVVALGRELGVPTPTHVVMYAALKPYAIGAPA